jgi:hypothetical protein
VTICPACTVFEMSPNVNVCDACWGREQSAHTIAQLRAELQNLRAAVRAADAFFAGWKAGDRSRWESAYAEYMADRAKCGEVT